MRVPEALHLIEASHRTASFCLAARPTQLPVRLRPLNTACEEHRCEDDAYDDDVAAAAVELDESMSFILP